MRCNYGEDKYKIQLGKLTEKVIFDEVRKYEIIFDK